MGRRGPAPGPTSLKMLRGARPARINFAEPRPRDLPPERPGWLSDGAAAEWDRVVPDLEASGTVKAADSTCMAAYCEAVARWRRLTRLAAAQDPVAVRDDAGAEPGVQPGAGRGRPRGAMPRPAC